jgi:hypothetical protein
MVFSGGPDRRVITGRGGMDRILKGERFRVEACWNISIVALRVVGCNKTGTQCPGM